MATNRIDILDSALLRPGRIDRKIEFPPPNEQARADILKIHSRKMNLTRGINLLKVAEMMTGSSGAEVKVIITSEKKLKRIISIERVFVRRQVCLPCASDDCTLRKKTLKWPLQR